CGADQLAHLALDPARQLPGGVLGGRVGRRLWQEQHGPDSVPDSLGHHQRRLMAGKPTGVTDPTLRMERAMLREGARLIIGCDEVGRGAIAGPVAVGLSVFAGRAGGAPKGLRDSKMLSEPKREELYPVVAEWSVQSSVGLASNEEVERIGIIAALGLAAVRALAELHDLGVAMDGAVVLL